jgi:hypothetical protein
VSAVEEQGLENEELRSLVQPLLGSFEIACRDYRPSAEDALAQALYDALLSIGSLLRRACKQAVRDAQAATQTRAEDHPPRRPFVDSLLKSIEAMGKQVQTDSARRTSSPRPSSETILVGPPLAKTMDPFPISSPSASAEEGQPSGAPLRDSSAGRAA